MVLWAGLHLAHWSLLCTVFSPLPTCWQLVSVFVGHMKFSWYRLHSPATGTLCPVPVAMVWPGSVAQGECCPLTWPVGNELQLLILSVPDAFLLHRHCAVFGTQLCFVNAK